jgi:hypothetical protein
MEAENTYEVFVDFYNTTRPNISEDTHLLTGRCENLKSYTVKNLLVP